MTPPRIAPLASDAREPRTEELLRSLRFDPDGDDMNLFTTLAHHPRLLKRWSAFGGLLLAGGELPGRDREVLILRTAANCGADYEWGHHLVIGRAVGLTDDEMTALAGSGAADVDALLVAAADELHATNVISEDTWSGLAERYTEAQLIEVCMVVGQYHLVAFTLRSLGIQPEDGVQGDPVVSGLLDPEALRTGRLAGRRILVVGAGTRASDDPDAPPGNGRAISVLAAQEGASVACADVDRGAARATADLIRDEGGHAQVVVADVSKPEACEAMVATAAELLGGLDGIVLNVGIGAGRWLGKTEPEQWDAVFDVNVRAHFLTCRAAFPVLDDGSSIVFVSSVAGLRPGSTIPAYDASKAALAGLSRHVALEGARRNIRANVVAPGLIDTPLGRLATEGRPSRTKAPVALGRQGTAWEVAAPVVFLLSSDASYVTAQVLAVDGGLSTM